MAVRPTKASPMPPAKVMKPETGHGEKTHMGGWVGVGGAGWGRVG